jgi:hypothetical protein
VIFAAIVWTAARLGGRASIEAPPRIRASAIALLVLVLLQLYLGALVAGLRAGMIYNTWPLIDGAFIPDAARLLFEQPAWRNFFENALTVQFCHRMVAYVLWLFAVLHAFDVARTVGRGPAMTHSLVLVGLVTFQAALGIRDLGASGADRLGACASGGRDPGIGARDGARAEPGSAQRRAIARRRGEGLSRLQRLLQIVDDVGGSSSPIESRTTSGPAPACTFCASESWRCVVDAGWMIERARVADIGEMREQLHVRHELDARLVAALEPEGEHRARRPSARISSRGYGSGRSAGRGSSPTRRSSARRARSPPSARCRSGAACAAARSRCR